MADTKNQVIESKAVKKFRDRLEMKVEKEA
jgi:hypothetical protein